MDTKGEFIMRKKILIFMSVAVMSLLTACGSQEDKVASNQVAQTTTINEVRETETTESKTTKTETTKETTKTEPQTTTQPHTEVQATTQVSQVTPVETQPPTQAVIIETQTPVQVPPQTEAPAPVETQPITQPPTQAPTEVQTQPQTETPAPAETQPVKECNHKKCGTTCTHEHVWNPIYATKVIEKERYEDVYDEVPVWEMHEIHKCSCDICVNSPYYGLYDNIATGYDPTGTGIYGVDLTQCFEDWKKKNPDKIQKTEGKTWCEFMADDYIKLYSVCDVMSWQSGMVCVGYEEQVVDTIYYAAKTENYIDYYYCIYNDCAIKKKGEDGDI